MFFEEILKILSGEPLIDGDEPHRKPYMTTKAGRLIELLEYKHLCFYAVFNVLYSSFIFSISSLFGKDILIKGLSKACSLQDFCSNLLESFYFSIVTLTTLGYGDLSPIGFGKILSLWLAISGVVVFAMLVSKISSERQLAILVLLHTSDVEKRLREYSFFLKEKRLIVIKSKTDFLNDPNGNLDDIFFELKILNNMVSSIFNFLRIHQKQSIRNVFDTVSSIYNLERELFNLHKTLLDILIVASYCEDLQKEILRLSNKLRQIDSFEVFPPLKRGKQKFNSVHQEIQKWNKYEIKESMLKKILEKVPSVFTSQWPSNFSSNISKELGISKNQFSKCVNILIEREIINP